MLGALEMIDKSEYTNAVDLLGLDGDTSEELLGYLGRLNPLARARAVNKLTKRNIPSQGSRAEFEKFFNELPAHIKEQLLQGRLRLADHVVYSIKPVNASKTIKIFESQDVKEDGIRNISNAKLPKSMALLVSGIYLLQGVAASTSVEDMKQTVFDSIEGVGALSNGSFKFKANKKQLVSEMSNRKFITNGFSIVPKGFFKLANPRLIHDDVDIEFELDLGTVAGINPNTIIYVGLEGTATIP